MSDPNSTSPESPGVIELNPSTDANSPETQESPRVLTDLIHHADAHRESYRTASPWPHIVLEGLVNPQLIAAAESQAQDWPQWRGPNRDDKVSGFTPPKAWPQQLNTKWKVAVGKGDATPALVGDKLYVFARQEDSENDQPDRPPPDETQDHENERSHGTTSIVNVNNIYIQSACRSRPSRLCEPDGKFRGP